MSLPYASADLVEMAERSLAESSFRSNVVDQFLTMLAMEYMLDFDGESDFGSITRVDLDDELRVVLVVTEMLIAERSDATTLANLVSHYRADVAIGEGCSGKWWSDFYLMSADEAGDTQERFSAAYSEWLDDEDEDEEHDAAPIAGGLLEELRSAEAQLN